MKTALVDYGLGNLRSIKRGLEQANAKVIITSEKAEIINADAIVFPGVGAFREASKNLLKLSNVILEEIEIGKPLLGICLGLQLLFTLSTEGGLYKGLDVFKGKIVRLPSNIKVPHIGWNTIKIVKSNNPLLREIENNSYVYFVHSYYAEPENPDNILSKTYYGLEFPSSFSKKQMFLTQFHPEKSGDTGLQILKNFIGFVKR
jgi:glutamine amidotransferase